MDRARVDLGDQRAEARPDGATRGRDDERAQRPEERARERAERDARADAARAELGLRADERAREDARAEESPPTRTRSGPRSVPTASATGAHVRPSQAPSAPAIAPPATAALACAPGSITSTSGFARKPVRSHPASSPDDRERQRERGAGARARSTSSIVRSSYPARAARRRALNIANTTRAAATTRRGMTQRLSTPRARRNRCARVRCADGSRSPGPHVLRHGRVRRHRRRDRRGAARGRARSSPRTRAAACPRTTARCPCSATCAIRRRSARAMEQAAARFGRVDVCVANAGIWPPEDAPLDTMPEARVRDVLETNLLGAMWTARAFFAALKQHGPRADGRGASVTFIGSTAGRLGEPGHAEYAATKAALVGLTRSWKNEIVKVDPRGRVNLVEPGWTATEMAAAALAASGAIARVTKTMPLQQIATPADVARAVLFLSSPTAAQGRTSPRARASAVVAAAGWRGACFGDHRRAATFVTAAPGGARARSISSCDAYGSCVSTPHRARDGDARARRRGRGRVRSRLGRARGDRRIGGRRRFEQRRDGAGRVHRDDVLVGPRRPRDEHRQRGRRRRDERQRRRRARAPAACACVPVPTGGWTAVIATEGAPDATPPTCADGNAATTRLAGPAGAPTCASCACDAGAASCTAPDVS